VHVNTCESHAGATVGLAASRSFQRQIHILRESGPTTTACPTQTRR
jgi:hypothetical protein